MNDSIRRRFPAQAAILGTLGLLATATDAVVSWVGLGVPLAVIAWRSLR